MSAAATTTTVVAPESVAVELERAPVSKRDEE